MRQHRVEQLQPAIGEGHVLPGRDDIGTVVHDRHTVLDFGDLHTGITADQVGEQAVMIGGQMLHQHEGHAGVGICRHAGEKGLEGVQPAG